MFPYSPFTARQSGCWLLGAVLILLTGWSAVQAAAPTASPVPAEVTSKMTGLPAFSYLHGLQRMPKVKAGERVVFTLEGGVKPLNFTLAQLKALPTVQYLTFHPQLRRSFTYQGVPLRDLAQYGGFLGRDLRVYASNSFVATIRARDYLQEPIMLAYAADGKPIPVLLKGPLTVVLPLTPERFGTPEYSAAWVWFAVRLTPVP